MCCCLTHENLVSDQLWTSLTSKQTGSDITLTLQIWWLVMYKTTTHRDSADPLTAGGLTRSDPVWFSCCQQEVAAVCCCCVSVLMCLFCTRSDRLAQINTNPDYLPPALVPWSFAVCCTPCVCLHAVAQLHAVWTQHVFTYYYYFLQIQRFFIWLLFNSLFINSVFIIYLI